MDLPRPPSPAKRIKSFAFGAGLLTLIAVSLALARTRPAVPTVPDAQIVLDTVVRGDLVQEVRGAGKLLPEHQLLVPAVTSGRVERRRVEVGETVREGDVLLVLENPEIDLRLLEAERSLAEARMDRRRLAAAHEMDVLAARRELATLKTRLREAERRYEAVKDLARNGLVPKADASAAEDLRNELTEQTRLAERQAEVAESTFHSSLAALDEEIRRVERMAAFHRDRVGSLVVRSGVSGVVQELLPAQGQWVVSGELLARVFRPGDLKAELRVPEARSGEIEPGQAVVVAIRGEEIRGEVRRVSPAAIGGSVAVEIDLTGDLPASARPDLTVEGRIETGRVTHALHLRRPAGSAAGGAASLFRLRNEAAAERVSLRFGPASSERIAVVDGASEGDVFIVSDLRDLAGAQRIRIQR